MLRQEHRRHITSHFWTMPLDPVWGSGGIAMIVAEMIACIRVWNERSSGKVCVTAMGLSGVVQVGCIWCIYLIWLN
jgi:hypothetical protein